MHRIHPSGTGCGPAPPVATGKIPGAMYIKVPPFACVLVAVCVARCSESMAMSKSEITGRASGVSASIRMFSNIAVKHIVAMMGQLCF